MMVVRGLYLLWDDCTLLGLLCKNGSGLDGVYVNGTVSDNFTWCMDVRMCEDGSSLECVWAWDQYASMEIVVHVCMCVIMEVGVCSMFIVYVDVSRGGLRGCWLNCSVWTLGGDFYVGGYMCMNICGMECVIVVDSMDEMFISGGILAEFEHHEPLSLPVGVLARTHKYYTLQVALAQCCCHHSASVKSSRAVHHSSFIRFVMLIQFIVCLCCFSARFSSLPCLHYRPRL